LTTTGDLSACKSQTNFDTTINRQHQSSFEELKKRLTTTPVLVMPDLQRSFDIYCDASRQGLGCVLMQEGHVIAYASRQLRNMS
jgi:hypothetical protein